MSMKLFFAGTESLKGLWIKEEGKSGEDCKGTCAGGSSVSILSGKDDKIKEMNLIFWEMK